MNTDRFKFRVFNALKNKYALYWELRINEDGELLYKGVPLASNYIVEQCTGLKDKNGKLIYEGDVVRYYRSTAMGLGGERIASVRWDDRSGSWWILTTLGDGYDMYDALGFGIEIIGNIHEMESEAVDE